MNTMKKQNLSTILVIFFLLVLAGACTNHESQGAVLTETPAEIAAPATATSVPTETPLPGKVVLYAPAEVSVNYVNQFQTLLAQIVDASGLVLDVRESITENEIADDWKIVVLLATPENFDQIRNASPAVQFVRFTDDPTLTGEGNVSVIYSSKLEQAFMAGYVTMLSAPDFRAGGLLVWDDPVTGSEQQEAFENGAAYFCGRCASVYMPVTFFPVTTSLPSNSTAESWLDAFGGLNTEYVVYTAYVDAAAANQEVLNGLAASNIVLTGENTPENRDGLKWAATITGDSFGAFESIWDQVRNGVGGQTVKTSITVIDVDEQYLSSGRIRLVEETLASLMDGAILPLSPDYP